MLIQWTGVQFSIPMWWLTIILNSNQVQGIWCYLLAFVGTAFTWYTDRYVAKHLYIQNEMKNFQSTTAWKCIIIFHSFYNSFSTPLIGLCSPPIQCFCPYSQACMISSGCWLDPIPFLQVMSQSAPLVSLCESRYCLFLPWHLPSHILLVHAPWCHWIPNKINAQLKIIFISKRKLFLEEGGSRQGFSV